MTPAVREALAAVQVQPSDVQLQIAAAYACDRNGFEDIAIRHYDAAWRLGVSGGERANFLLGYGSTLRNVGRVDEALEVLGRLVGEDPGHHAARCLRALALEDAGRGAAALAELLDVVLELRGDSPSLNRYQTALAGYRDGLKTAR